MLSRLLSIPAAAFDATACSLKASANLLQRAADALQPAEVGTTTLPDTAADGPSAEEHLDAAPRATGASPAAATRQQGELSDLRTVADAAPGWAELSDGAESAAAEEPAGTAASEPPARRSTFAPDRLAAAPVKTVIAALDGLSSSELSALYEHEAANRNRKTLLRAIEQAVLPPDPTTDPRSPLAAAEDEALTQVGDIAVEVPSERVYSTESS